MSIKPKINIDRLKKHENKVGIAITGGGTGIIDGLLSQGGCSSFFVEAQIPYCQKALVSLLGMEPSHSYCSKNTAREMASKMKERVSKIHWEQDKAIGIGMTNSLRKIKGERLGRENKCFICVTNSYKTLEVEISFIKKERNDNDDDVADGIIRSIQEDSCAVSLYECLVGFLENLSKKDIFARIKSWHQEDVKVNIVTQNDIDQSFDRLEDIFFDESEGQNIVVYSGSFNPFHEGHERVLKTCGDMDESYMVILEVCTDAYRKVNVDHCSLMDRVESIDSFEVSSNVPITYFNKSLFVDKFHHYKSYASGAKIIFAIGDDVFDKLSAWAFGRGMTMAECFAQESISHTEMQFLVFPRHKDKLNYSKEDSLFINEESFKLNPCEFTKDHSSTKIRKQK